MANTSMAAIIVAAGSSTRMGQPKQWMPLKGKPVLAHTLQAFENTPQVTAIVVVTRPEDIDRVEQEATKWGITKLAAVVAGGSTRQQSVAAGVTALPADTQLVAIHDGARPLATPDMILRVAEVAAATGAASAAVKVKDTIKQADETGLVMATPDRSQLWSVQTPQIFQLDLYRQAMQCAADKGLDLTDDCGLMEAAGYPVTLCDGDYRNIKITTPEDVVMAEAFLGWRELNPVTPERSVLRARIVPSLKIRQYIGAPGLPDHHKTGSFRFKEVSAAAFSVRRSGIFAARLAPGKNERNGARIKAASETVTSSTLASLSERGGSTMRIGHGYDVHRLVEGRPLILGGVTIPHETGLLGHSDADVLLHAISDALLGAAALGDIGGWFPDTDDRYKGADSGKLLQEVVRMVAEKGYRIENIDATVLAQAPKLKPHIPAMRENIAAFCGMAADQINVKATTEEGLGFTGQKQGIAAHAVCILMK